MASTKRPVPKGLKEKKAAILIQRIARGKLVRLRNEVEKDVLPDAIASRGKVMRSIAEDLDKIQSLKKRVKHDLTKLKKLKFKNKKRVVEKAMIQHFGGRAQFRKAMGSQLQGYFS